MGLYKGLKRFSGRLRWLKRNAGKRTTNRLRWEISKDETSTLKSSGGMNLGFTGNGSIESWPGYSYRIDDIDSVEEYYYATLLMRYSIPEMGEIELKIRAFLDVLGVRLDPAIIWNAIPFSFVVDWVVDVGSFLRSLSLDNLGIRTEIIDFSHSVKSVITRKRRLTCYADLAPKYPLFGTPLDVMSVVKTRYERARTIPSQHAITTSGVSLGEAVLGTALVLANRRTKTRRRRNYPRSPRRDISMQDPW
jgi:hypothetical protein